jgi:endonuclease YncB( thermonuclease family)
MSLLKKTFMWAFFLAAMYFGGGMTQSENNFLQGMGFMSILAALICLYLVVKLIWGPLSHYMKIGLFIGIIWYIAYSIGLFDGNTLSSFLSGSPRVAESEDVVSPEDAAKLTELENEMFKTDDDEQPEDDGGLVGRIKTYLFGKKRAESAPVKAFNPMDYPSLQGYPQVLNGSVLSLNGIKIKLFGIDAPDLNQTCSDRMGQGYRCGERSALWLQDWLNGREVSCHILSKIESGWATGSCFTNNNQYDIAAVMVSEGWAVSYTRFTDIYVRYEQQAAEAHRGLWSGSFYKPWDWRRLQQRKFKIKIKSGKKKSSGKGFDFWGLI